MQNDKKLVVLFYSIEIVLDNCLPILKLSKKFFPFCIIIFENTAAYCIMYKTTL